MSVLILDPKRFEHQLSQVANSLAADIPIQDLPVDLLEVLAYFGLGAPLIEVGRSNMHGGLRMVDGIWHPVVYRSRPRRTGYWPRERFTIAHELAHALIEERSSLRPGRRAQYWRLESICDDFASKLLIPEPSLEARRRYLTAPDVAVAISRLAAESETSLAAAAKRLLEGSESVSALGVVHEYNPKKRQSDARVTWTAGNPCSRLRARSIIRSDVPLFQVASAELQQDESYEAPLAGEALMYALGISSKYRLIVLVKARSPEEAPDRPQQQSLDLEL